jgi:putative colanic acid biosynthesis acetyltransferase WcaF
MTEILTNIDPRTQPSFSLKNRLARSVWGIAYLFLFRTSPRPMHAWRAFLLKCFGAKIGANCHVYSQVIIWAPWNLVLEEQVGLADGVTCYTMAKITIKSKAVVSQGVHLCTGTHDYNDPNFQLYALPITIGANTWICADAFIGPGVNVGDGAVIGARSVVTKDMPAWTVCAGNPCKPLKQRILRH